MKQFAMKLFHKWLTACITAGYAVATPALAGESGLEGKSADSKVPAFAAPFDAAKGFKPVQSNFTEVFLQIAGSLEATGSIEGYIRHIQAEQVRIAAAWEKKTGKALGSRLPARLTPEHFEKVLKNWKVLAAPLQLGPFAKEIGRCAREGIMGTRLTGTVAVQFFNEHQKSVVVSMQGDSAQPAGFAELRSRLERELEFDKEIVSLKGYETSRRDAVSYAMGIKDAFEKKFEEIDRIAKAEKAAQIKDALLGWFMDLGFLAQAELELGILEAAMKQL